MANGMAFVFWCISFVLSVKTGQVVGLLSLLMAADGEDGAEEILH